MTIKTRCQTSSLDQEAGECPDYEKAEAHPPADRLSSKILMQ